MFFLKKALNMIEPDATLDAKGVIVISSEEDETECNNDKKLIDLQICDGALLKVDDFLQNYELSIIITHADAEHDKPLFEVIADPDTLKPKENDEKTSNDDNTETDNTKSSMVMKEAEDDCIEVVEEKRARTSNVNGNGNSELSNDKKNDKESEEDDCMIVQTSSTTPNLKRKTAGTDDAGEGSSSSVAKKLKITTDDMDDDIVILEDD